MRVLYRPQLSMRSYREDRWLVASDSQATKMRAWMRALPDGWEWTWLLPEHGERPVLDADIVFMPWAPNVQTDRHLLDVQLVKALEMVRPHVVIAEAIEHVAPFKEALRFLGMDVPVIGMIGLYDDRGSEFYLRQLEGFLAADHVVFPLEVVEKRWLDRTMNMVSPKLSDRIGDKDWSVVPAIFDPEEVRSVIKAETAPPSVFFISRLSDEPRTKYELFFETVKLLEATGARFQTWIANPNEAMTRDEVLDACPSASIVGPISRQEYLRKLRSATVVPFFQDLEEGYSVGALEAIAAGCYVAPDPKHVALGLADEMLPERRKLEEWMQQRTVEAHIEKFRTTVEEMVR